MTQHGEVIEHGGALAEATARFGAPPGGWLDLSTGINPWPYPLPVLDDTVWQVLPDCDTVQTLRAAAAACYGAPAPGNVAVAPGSQALIQMLPRLLPPERVAVVGFTYGEHAVAWTRAGHEVITVRTIGEGLSQARRVVVTNPNNPDGRRHSPMVLKAAAASTASRKGLLVVDEAFADVTPDISMASRVGSNGLAVLRSFGKFFGLAGVRLGFALTDPAMAAALQDAFGPWAVSGPALALGALALADQDWIDGTRLHLQAAARDLQVCLAQAGLEVVGGTDLFVLAQTPKAQALYQHLGRNGVLVRSFAQRPEWLRFGPCTDLTRLAALLRSGPAL